MFNELTKTDIEKMKEEIKYRTEVLRPQISQEIIDARAQGDLSENAEYHAARKAKGQNESRIEYLTAMIKTAKIVESDETGEGVALFDKVEVLFEEENSIEVVRLSTIMRNDASQGIISKESPFGKAIIGKKVGDRVEVQVSPDYSYHVVIKSITKSNGDDIDLPIV